MEKQTIKVTVENEVSPLYKGGDDPPVSWQLHTIMGELSFMLQQDYEPHLVEDEMLDYLTRTFKHPQPKNEEEANQQKVLLHQIARACGQFADTLAAVDSTEMGAKYVRYNSRRHE